MTTRAMCKQRGRLIYDPDAKEFCKPLCKKIYFKSKTT